MFQMKVEVYTRNTQKQSVKISEFVYPDTPRRVVKVYYNGHNYYDAIIENHPQRGAN